MKRIFASISILAFLVLLAGCVPALFQVSGKGDISAVKSLLDQGVDVNERFTSFTALMEASRQGRIEVVKMLIDRGANMNAINRGGWTALSLAAKNGHTDIVKLLLDRGADIDKAICAAFNNKYAKSAIEVLQEFKQQKVAN